MSDTATETRLSVTECYERAAAALRDPNERVMRTVRQGIVMEVTAAVAIAEQWRLLGDSMARNDAFIIT